MSKKLLEQVLRHVPIGEMLGHGVAEQVRVHSLRDASLLGYLFHDLLDAPLRVVSSVGEGEGKT